MHATAQDIDGTYKYQREGLDGGISVTSQDISTVHIQINTANASSLDTCIFDGKCKRTGNKILCTKQEYGTTSTVKIEISNNTLTITDYSHQELCGRNAIMEGVYKK